MKYGLNNSLILQIANFSPYLHFSKNSLMRQYPFLLFVFTCLIGLQNIAAQPDWSLTPNDFEFTMTVTGVAVTQCVESTDENDIVGAFINGEVRGVQALDTDINGRQFAYMIIYNNDFNGNEVTFKIYDASLDTIYEAQQTVTYQENGIIGNEDAPFIFNTALNLTNTFLTQDSIDENALAGSVVADIQSVNEIQDTFTLIYEFVNDNLGPDNQYFIISDSTLILTEDVNANEKTSYQIHVSGNTPDGCSRDDVFTLHVTGQGTTSVNDPHKKPIDDILIYPNPATSIIQFATEKNIERVCIYSVEGKPLHTIWDLFQTNSLDVSFLKPGLYMVGCYVNGVMSMRKLIVQE